MGFTFSYGGSGAGAAGNAPTDFSYRGKAANLVQFTITRSAFAAANQNTPFISFWVNPNETQWRIATRTTIEKIFGGAVHHEWPQIGIGKQQPQQIDQPVVHFSFQSGLIIPGGTDDSNDPYGSIDALTGNPTVPNGLGNFYDFCDLLDHSEVYIDDDGNQQPNYFEIFYSSAVFPSLYLYGFFSPEGVQWTESADNPNMVTGWGASFVVLDSNPNLFDAAALSGLFSATSIKSPTGASLTQLWNRLKNAGTALQNAGNTLFGGG